jgi:hypothetical protein
MAGWGVEPHVFIDRRRGRRVGAVGVEREWDAGGVGNGKEKPLRPVFTIRTRVVLLSRIFFILKNLQK